MVFKVEPVDITPAEEPIVNIEGEAHRVYDADTVIPVGEGKSKRVKGVDAAEFPKDLGGSAIGPVETGALEQRQAIANLMNTSGFKKPIKIEEDVYGREITRFHDESGKDLAYEAVEKGHLRPSQYDYSSGSQNIAYFTGNFLRMAEGVKAAPYRDNVRRMSEVLLNGINPITQDFKGSDMTKEQATASWLRLSNGNVNRLVKERENALTLVENGADAEIRNIAAKDVERIDNELQSIQILKDSAIDPAFIRDTAESKARLGFAGNLIESGQLALYNMQNHGYGFIAVAGDAFGIESLEKWGSEGITENLEEIRREIDPRTIQQLQDIRGLKTGLQWSANQLATFGPEYALMAGLPAAGATLGSVVPGVGTAVGFTIGSILSLGYTYIQGVGSTAAEQIEVDGEVHAGEALVLGTIIAGLNRVGVRAGQIKPKEVLTDEGVEKVIAHLGEKGFGRQEAINYFSRNYRQVLNDIGREAVTTADDLLGARARASYHMRRLAARTGIEAATETAQELVQGIGVNGVPQSTQDWKDFGWRLANAGAAGGVVGGGLNVGSIAYDRAVVNEFADGYRIQTEEDKSEDEKATDLMQRKYKDKAETEILVKEKILNATGFEPTAEERGTRRKNKPYFIVNLSETLKARFIPTASARSNDTRAIRYKPDGTLNPNVILWDNVTSARGNIGGNSHPKELRLRLGQMRSYVETEDAATAYGLKDTDEVNDYIEHLVETDFNPDYTKYDKAAMDRITKQLVKVSKKNIEYANKAVVGDDVQYTLTETFQVSDEAYEAQDAAIKEQNIRGLRNLIIPSLPNIDAVTANKQDAIEDFMKLKPAETDDDLFEARPLDRDEATELVENIAEQKNLPQTIARLHELQAYKTLDGKYYNSKDHWDNIVKNHAAQITHSTFNEYYGNEGSLLPILIEDSLKTGDIDGEGAEIWASNGLRHLEKVRGTFGQIQNKSLRDLQDAALGINTILTLEWTAFAQAPEAFYATAFLENPEAGEVVGTSVAAIGNELVGTAKWYAGGASLGKVRPKRFPKDSPNEQVREIGYGTKEQLAAQTAPGVSSPLATKSVGILMRANLNEALTLAPKAVVYAFSWPEIEYLVKNEVAHRAINGGKVTLNQARGRERLAKYGQDIEFLVETYDAYGTLDPSKSPIQLLIEGDEDNDIAPDEEFTKKFERANHIAALKMIDESTATIEPGSVPAPIQDKRLGMFTQYLSFISHFHANILPRLYEQYLSGNKGTIMAYAAFRHVAYAFAMALLAQWLKDYIKYGESSPYLSDGLAVYQRALEYSAITGVFERGLDVVHPTYKEYGPGFFQEAFGPGRGPLDRGGAIIDEIIDKSPALGTARTTYSRFNRADTAEEYGDAALKSLPLGDSVHVRNLIKNGGAVFADLFNGDE